MHACTHPDATLAQGPLSLQQAARLVPNQIPRSTAMTTHFPRIALILACLALGITGTEDVVLAGVPEETVRLLHAVHDTTYHTSLGSNDESISASISDSFQAKMGK